MFLNNRKHFSYLRSIRTKLVLVYAYIIIATILAISFFFYSYISHRLLKLSKEYLQNELQAVVQLIKNKPYSSIELIDLFSRQILFNKGSHQINYALYNRYSDLLVKSANFSENKTSQERINLLKDTVDFIYEGISIDTVYKNKLLYATSKFNTLSERSYYLQFEINRRGQDDTSDIFLEIIILSFPIILVFALVSGYFLTKWVLSPVSKITKTARNISMTNQYLMLPIAGTGDELDELAITFNETFKKLHQSYQNVIRFTADASHELRLPITAIKGEAEIILEKPRTPDEYRLILESIIEEMDRLSQIIKQLLTLTRSDSTDYELSKESMDFVVFFNKLIEFYEALAESEHIQLSFVTIEKEALYLGDQFKLQELFSNLIENAIRYTLQGGFIKIELFKSDLNYKILITDTGIGIPKDEHAKIFDRFYRVDKARSRKYGGSGLGLSIVKMIVNAHKGQIEVDSTPGKGSSFTITLPIV